MTPRLLRRAKLLPDESLLSFLTRLAKLNHTSLHYLLGIGINQRNKFSKTANINEFSLNPQKSKELERLSDICDIKQEELLLASNFRFFKLFSSKPRGIIRTTTQEWYSANTNIHKIKILLTLEQRAKYCPHCLSDSVYHRLSWVPKSLIVCLRHECLLIDCCPKCGKNISINEIIDCCCNSCYSDLRICETIFVGDDKYGMKAQRYLAKLFGVNEVFSDDEFGKYPNLPPVVVFRLINSLQNLFFRNEKLFKNFFPPLCEMLYDPSLTERAQEKLQLFLMERAACLPLSDWPKNFYSFLDAFFDLDTFSGYRKYEDGVETYFNRIDHNVVIRELVNYFLDRDIHIPPYLISIALNERWFIRQIGALTKETALKILNIGEEEITLHGSDIYWDFQKKNILGQHKCYDRLGVMILKNKIGKELDLKTTSSWFGFSEKSIIMLIEQGELDGRLIMEESNVVNAFIKRESIDSLWTNVFSELDHVFILSQSVFKKLEMLVNDLGIFGITITTLLKCAGKKLLPYLGDKVYFGVQLYVPIQVAKDLFEILLLDRGWVNGADFHHFFEPRSDEQYSLGGEVQGLIKPVSCSQNYIMYDKRELEELIKMTYMLVNRPVPLDNESLDSFLSRVRECNYYQEMNWMGKILNIRGNPNFNFVLRQDNIKKIAEFTGVTEDRIRKMTVHHYAPKMNRLGYWDEGGRNLFISKSSTERLCPFCYKKNKVILLPWLFRPVTACAVHKILLENKCPECGKILSGNRGCGACRKSLDKLNFKRIDQNPIELKFVTLIWRILTEENTNSSLVDSDYPLSVINSPQFFSLLLILGRLLLEYDSNNPHFTFQLDEESKNKSTRRTLRELSVKEYHQVMVAVFELFFDWPVNWHNTLKRILSNEESRRMGNNGSMWKRRSFPYQLRKVLAHDPGFAWLIESLKDFIQINRDIIPGINYWIRYLEEGLKMPLSIPIQAFNSNDCIISNEEMNNILSFNSAADYLGISRGNLLELINRGLVNPVTKNKPNVRNKWRFLKRHLNDVIEYLVGHLEYRDFVCEETEVVWLDKTCY